MLLRSLKFLSLLVVLGLLLPGCAHPHTAPASAQQTLGGMVVTLNSNSPHTGDNTITITVTDANTKSPVGNANITATAEMISPRLPGTQVSGRAQGNGLYSIPVRFGVATRYHLTLHIQRPGQSSVTVVFPIDAAE